MKNKKDKVKKYSTFADIRGEIVFRVIIGSQAYGTSTPESDIDYKGVYIQNQDDILSFGYIPIVEISKDECYYEIRRFLELLEEANPTCLEMLYSPDDCIVKKLPVFDLVLENKEKFLTIKCLQSFSGYATDQIKKASGLNKKMNWDKKRVTRKNPIDFLYAYINGKTMPVIKWLKIKNKRQEYCGLIKLKHFRDGYALYYDSSENPDSKDFLGFKGIVMDNSNSVRLSSIPKGINAETNLYYNKDGYSVHCKDYKSYLDWKENSNKQRYVDVEGHNQQMDGKNILHCVRLLETSIDIAIQEKIIIRRPNANYLLDIRRGKYDLKTIIKKCTEEMKELPKLYKNSNLPKPVSREFVNELLLKIRHFKN